MPSISYGQTGPSMSIMKLDILDRLTMAGIVSSKGGMRALRSPAGDFAS